MKMGMPVRIKRLQIWGKFGKTSQYITEINTKLTKIQ